MNDASTFVLQLPHDIFEALAHRAAEIVRTDQRFLSKPALALHLGISERRVKTMREHGMPARKIGRDLYFDLEEVNAWLDQHLA